MLIFICVGSEEDRLHRSHFPLEFCNSLQSLQMVLSACVLEHAFLTNILEIVKQCENINPYSNKAF